METIWPAKYLLILLSRTDCDKHDKIFDIFARFKKNCGVGSDPLKFRKVKVVCTQTIF